MYIGQFHQRCLYVGQFDHWFIYVGLFDQLVIYFGLFDQPVYIRWSIWPLYRHLSQELHTRDGCKCDGWHRQNP